MLTLRSLSFISSPSHLLCRHLGSFINAQKATLADSKTFFGLLHAFAQELAGAHQENAAADAAACQPPGRGRVRAGAA